MPTFRERLVEFYRQHNPEKVGDVDGILRTFRGREEQMFDALRRKYEQTPPPLRLEAPPPPPLMIQQRQAHQQPPVAPRSPALAVLSPATQDWRQSLERPSPRTGLGGAPAEAGSKLQLVTAGGSHTAERQASPPAEAGPAPQLLLLSRKMRAVDLDSLCARLRAEAGAAHTDEYQHLLTHTLNYMTFFARCADEVAGLAASVAAGEGPPRPAVRSVTTQTDDLDEPDGTPLRLQRPALSSSSSSTEEGGRGPSPPAEHSPLPAPRNDEAWRLARAATRTPDGRGRTRSPPSPTLSPLSPSARRTTIGTVRPLSRSRSGPPDGVPVPPHAPPAAPLPPPPPLLAQPLRRVLTFTPETWPEEGPAVADGDCVALQPGTYLARWCLRVAGAVQLTGAFPGAAVVLRPASALEPAVAVHGPDTHLEARGIVFAGGTERDGGDGPGGGEAGRPALVAASGGAQLRLEGSHLYDGAGGGFVGSGRGTVAALVLTNVARCGFAGAAVLDGAVLHLGECAVRDCSAGLRVGDGCRAAVAGTTVERCRGDGVVVMEGAELQLTHSTVDSNGGNGIFAMRGARVLCGHSCIELNSLHGIQRSAGCQIELSGSFLRDNGMLPMSAA